MQSWFSAGRPAESAQSVKRYAGEARLFVKCPESQGLGLIPLFLEISCSRYKLTTESGLAVISAHVVYLVWLAPLMRLFTLGLRSLCFLTLVNPIAWPAHAMVKGSTA